VAVTVPLKKVKPGASKLLVKEYGSKEPDTVPPQVFAEAGHLDSFTLHAGHLSGVLKGSHLDEVKELILNGISFKPEQHATVEDAGELSPVTADVKAVGELKEKDGATAKVALIDGRVLSLETTVASPRPKVSLTGKSVQPSATATASNFQLADQDDVPQSAQLTFSIHAQVPASFSGDEKVAVATVQGAYLATLTPANGLTLEDSHVALATLDSEKAFASSASGPLRFRVTEKGITSDWQPLATLVRLPAFGDLQCPDLSDQLCRLTGSKLFLVDSVSNNLQFDHPTQVPEGFPGYVLTVLHPTTGYLYVKLHDDPSVVNSVLFPAEALPHPIATTSQASSEPAGQIPDPSAAGVQSNPSTVTATAPPPAAESTSAPVTKQATPSAAPPLHRLSRTNRRSKAPEALLRRNRPERLHSGEHRPFLHRLRQRESVRRAAHPRQPICRQSTFNGA
jgi:hypothetical protein